MKRNSNFIQYYSCSKERMMEKKVYAVKETQQSFMPLMEQITNLSLLILVPVELVHRKALEVVQAKILVAKILHQNETIAGAVNFETEKMEVLMIHLTFRHFLIFQNFAKNILKDIVDVQTTKYHCKCHNITLAIPLFCW